MLYDICKYKDKTILDKPYSFPISVIKSDREIFCYLRTNYQKKKANGQLLTGRGWLIDYALPLVSVACDEEIMLMNVDSLMIADAVRYPRTFDIKLKRSFINQKTFNRFLPP